MPSARTRRRVIRSIGRASVLVVFLLGVAHAQVPPGPPPRETASTAWEQAEQLFRQQQWCDAAPLFLRVLEMDPADTTKHRKDAACKAMTAWPRCMKLPGRRRARRSGRRRGGRGGSTRCGEASGRPASPSPVRPRDTRRSRSPTRPGASSRPARSASGSTPGFRIPSESSIGTRACFTSTTTSPRHCPSSKRSWKSTAASWPSTPPTWRSTAPTCCKCTTGSSRTRSVIAASPR